MPSVPWKAGMSPNPGGQPKGKFLFSKIVAEATKDGLMMLKVAMKIALDDFAPPQARMSAVEYLTDRWIGKVPMVIEVVSGVRPDLAVLSTAELEQLRAIAVKALPPPVESKP